MRSAYFIAAGLLASCSIDAGEVQGVLFVVWERVVMPVSGNGMLKFEDKLPAGHCFFEEGGQVDFEGRFEKDGEVLDGEGAVLCAVCENGFERIPGFYRQESAGEVFVFEGLCKRFTQIYIGDARDVFLGEDESC